MAHTPYRSTAQVSVVAILALLYVGCEIAADSEPDAGPPEICDNGRDDDGDNDVDCDDDDCDEGPACNADAPVCGNSEIEDDEECDDGNNDDRDGCDGGCRIECEGPEGAGDAVLPEEVDLTRKLCCDDRDTFRLPGVVRDCPLTVSADFRTDRWSDSIRLVVFAEEGAEFAEAELVRNFTLRANMRPFGRVDYYARVVGEGPFFGCEDGYIYDISWTQRCGDCGDGAVQRGEGEECDDGNTVTEVCEYGQTACTVCAADCTEEPGVTSYCGDGDTDGDNGEECDDGSNEDGDGCDADCVDEFCGDDVVNDAGSEECDDGNNEDGDGCDADCVDEFCGDDIVNDAPNEECDDGGNEPGDGCDELCRTEHCSTCSELFGGSADPLCPCDEPTIAALTDCLCMSCAGPCNATLCRLDGPPLAPDDSCQTCIEGDLEVDCASQSAACEANEVAASQCGIEACYGLAPGCEHESGQFCVDGEDNDEDGPRDCAGDPDCTDDPYCIDCDEELPVGAMDDNEPNDALVDASEIELDVAVPGVVCVNDGDFFAIDIPDLGTHLGCRLTAQVEQGIGGADPSLRLELLESSREDSLGRASGSPPLAVTHRITAADEAFAVHVSDIGETGGTSYQLTPTLNTTGCEPWACLGTPLPDPAEADTTIEVWVTAVTFLPPNNPINGAAWSICDDQPPETVCDTPIASGTTGADGLINGEIDLGDSGLFDGYLQVTGVGLYPTLFMANPYLVDDFGSSSEPIVVPFVDATTFGFFLSNFSVFPTTTGHLFVALNDCPGAPTAGLTVEVQATDDGEVVGRVVYVGAGGPNEDLDATAGAGTALVFDLPPDESLTATYRFADTGQIIGEAELFVPAGNLGILPLYPTP